MTELNTPPSMSEEKVKAMLDNIVIKSAKSPNTKPNAEITATLFLKAVKHEKLTGSEFLEIIGNSKINKEVYDEIEKNPMLTFNQLVALLESTNMTSDDYTKLLLSVQKRSKAKQEALRRISEAELAAAISKNEQRRKEQPAADETATQAQNVPEESIPTDAQSAEKDDDTVKKNEERERLLSLGFDEEDLDVKDSNAEKQPLDIKKKLVIVVAVAAVILIAISFGIRYVTTGSLFINNGSGNEKTEQITTQAELFDKIAELSYGYETLSDSADEYYTAASEQTDARELLTSYSDNSYLYYFRNDALHIISAISGKMISVAEIRRDDAKMLGFAYYDGVIAVIYQKTNKDVTYKYQKEKDGEKIDVEGKYDENLVVVEIYRGSFEKPVQTYYQSGIFRELVRNSAALYIIADMPVAKNNAQEIPQTYIPYFFSDENTDLAFADIKNICIPEKIGSANYTVICGTDLSADEITVSLSAALGGKTKITHSAGASYYIAQNESDYSQIVKYTLNNKGIVTAEASIKVDGNIRNDVYLNENGGVLRAIASRKNGDSASSSVYVFAEDMASCSVVENIAVGKTISGAAFDENNVYIIADGEESSLYAVNTAAATPELLPEIDKKLYSNALAKWKDDMYASFVPTADEAGNRTGYDLTMYNTKNGMEVLSNISFVPIVDAVNYSDYLSSAVDGDISSMYISASDNLIIVPIKYYNGVAEVEEFEAYTYSDSDGLVLKNKLVKMDLYSDYQRVLMNSNYIYAIFGDKIVSSDLNMTVIEEMTVA